MELRTVIVEDRQPDAQRLELLLKQAFAGDEVVCRTFASGDELLCSFCAGEQKVVFLYICMEGTNGIETARHSPPDKKRCTEVYSAFLFVPNE